jgi:hypothetical protein
MLSVFGMDRQVRETLGHAKPENWMRPNNAGSFGFHRIKVLSKADKAPANPVGPSVATDHYGVGSPELGKRYRR